MTNQQILKKAIEKAVKNGWKFEFDDKNYTYDWLDRNMREHIIFNHDFAKAFWGDKEIELPNPEWCGDMPVYDSDLEHDSMYAWAYHLQQMVLEKEPLKYLVKFL